MKNEIFIKPDEPLTLEQYLPIASHTMSLIAEAAESIDEIEETFSITNLVVLLNELCVHMAGEFEVCRTHPPYCQITYKPFEFNEAEADQDYLLSDFREGHNASETRLWISNEVVMAFIDRKLHGTATVVYFYLGYLMTQDHTFGMSQNISFERILESCDALPEISHMKYRTTLLRALADLEDSGLIRWNVNRGTFEWLHITPYDPNQRV